MEKIVEPLHRASPVPAVGTNESVVEEFIDRELKPHRVGKDVLPHGHGPLPIIIAVTGHRDLRTEDIPQLEAVVREEYSRLQAQHPATSFILLSALADGADRLCARLATQVGMRLIVVLPMPVDLYESDFDETSKKGFRALLASAAHTIELPIIKGFSREDIIEHGWNREQQYAQAGAYLATHSAILVALWDGVPLHKVGGSSQVVRFKLDGVPEPFAPPHSELDAPDSGPVYHIVTPRTSGVALPAHPFSVHRLYPSGYASRADADRSDRDIYERVEAFNQDAIRYAEELKERRRASKEYILPSRLHVAMPAPLRELLDFYAIADVLSQRFQKRTFATLRLLLTFVFFAALFYELYSGPIADPVMIALYLGMFILAFVSYDWARRRGYQSKYLDYRALAEGLRVQLFWKLAGLKDSVADYYLRKQKSELDWIRHAVRSCMTETSPDDNAPLTGPNEERLRLVLKHWVEDQAKYFARAAHRDHERLHRHERTITFLFGTTLVLAALALAIGTPSPYIVLGIGVLPVTAALMHSYSQKNALAEHTKQYDRMSVFYHRAKLHLEKLIGEGRLEDAQAFIGELGREALAENGDWILTHRDRPLEVPKGA